MTSVKGVYENGQIKLLEEVKTKTSQKVIVTFIDEESQCDDIDVRNLTLSQPKDFFKDYLIDEREDLYQDYTKKDEK
ncbi:MAG: hypothetical protein M3352_06835 [Bacteroidota bacterium]|nr:hypothetical protein [Bacteroidota bacterium]